MLELAEAHRDRIVSWSVSFALLGRTKTIEYVRYVHVRRYILSRNDEMPFSDWLFLSLAIKRRSVGQFPRAPVGRTSLVFLGPSGDDATGAFSH